MIFYAFSTQEPASIAPRKATAVRFHSLIAGVDTTVAPGLETAGNGAGSLQTTEQTKSGGTAGEENDVRRLLVIVILILL